MTLNHVIINLDNIPLYCTSSRFQKKAVEIIKDNDSAALFSQHENNLYELEKIAANGLRYKYLNAVLFFSSLLLLAIAIFWPAISEAFFENKPNLFKTIIQIGLLLITGKCIQIYLSLKSHQNRHEFIFRELFFTTEKFDELIISNFTMQIYLNPERIQKATEWFNKFKQAKKNKVSWSHCSNNYHNFTPTTSEKLKLYFCQMDCVRKLYSYEWIVMLSTVALIMFLLIGVFLPWANNQLEIISNPRIIDILQSTILIGLCGAAYALRLQYLHKRKKFLLSMGEFLEFSTRPSVGMKTLYTRLKLLDKGMKGLSGYTEFSAKG